MIDFGDKIIVCEKCSAKFLVKSVTINKCSVEIGNKVLLFEHFACPECDELYKVLLVEESKYNELVKDLLLTIERMRKQEGKGNVYIFNRLQKMVIRKKARIQSYVQSMNKKYPGTFTFKASKNNQKEIIYLPIYRECEHGHFERRM